MSTTSLSGGAQGSSDPPLRVRLPHGDALENECAVMRRDARQRARRAMGEERRRLTGEFYGVVMVYIIVMGRYV